MIETRAENHLIEQYVSGGLTGKERDAFEERIASDPVLADKVALEQDIFDTIHNASRAHFQQKLRRLESDMVQSKKKTKLIRIAATAIAAVFIAIVGVWYFAQQPLNESLYATYYQPYQEPAADQVDASLSPALGAYNAQQYDKAKDRFLQVLATDADNTVALFYTGQCFMALGQTEEAVTYFDQVIKQGDTPYQKEAEWYVSLAHLKNNDLDSSLEHWTTIIQQNHPKASEAGKLVKKVK